MLRCREVARLCASDDIGDARWKTRTAVRVHLLMCRHCRRYVRELRRIGAAVRALRRNDDDEERNEDLIRRVLRDSTPPS